MERNLFIKLILVALLALPLISNAAVSKIQVPVNSVFIPGGFDSTTEAYAVISGLFPNGCYSFKESTVDHVGQFEHVVKSYADVVSGVCIRVMIPFSHEVSLGLLATGIHKVKFDHGDGTFFEKTMQVE